MAGTWTALGPRYTAYRDAIAAYVAGLADDTVVTSHFVAINAVIGACTGDDRLVIRSLDNTSVTVVETSGAGMVARQRWPGSRHADPLNLLANATQDWHHSVAVVLIVVQRGGRPRGRSPPTSYPAARPAAVGHDRRRPGDDVRPGDHRGRPDDPLRHPAGPAPRPVRLLGDHRRRHPVRLPHEPVHAGKQYLLYAGGSLFIMGLGLRELLALSRPSHSWIRPPLVGVNPHVPT